MSKDKTGWNKYQRGPVRQASKEITVTIDSLGNNGDGIGRHDGKVIFVPFTLPGERVRVNPTTRKKSWMRAQVLETVNTTPERQTPPCSYFEQCGGCDWQHVPYPLQLQAKVQHLFDVLSRIGKLPNPDINTIVPSGLEYHYRNRIQGIVRNGQFHFKRRGSDQLVAIDRCEIADEAINLRLDEGFSPRTEGRVEITEVDGQVSVVAIDDEHLSDTGFTQINNVVSHLLTQHVQHIAEQNQGKQCIDLYCGRGNWSLDMARRQPQSRVIGVDASEHNINSARSAALEAGLNNVRFQHGRVEKLLKSLPLTNSFCIVDPPRAGLDEKVCQALCQNPPDNIVYISCHPASLARDVQMLTSENFRFDSITPFDMFPQTAHLESVTVLSRNATID